MPLDLQERDVIRRRIPQLYAAFAATLGGAAFGMVLGWSAPALEMLKAEATYTDEELSWVAGIPPLGSLVSMMLMALTLDRFGRKVVMLALVPPFVLGWLLLAFFRSIPLLLVGRFITGFCGAGYCTAAPVYTGEIAEKQIRGALGVFYQLMLTLGFLLAYFVGKLSGLRVLSLLCGIVPLVFFVAFFAMPESPVYLLDRERREDAVKALQWLRGPATDISQELCSMDELIADSRRHKDSIKEKMGKKSTRRALMIGLGLMFAQQLTGVSIISFHSKTIFTAAGDTTDFTVCFSVMGIMQVLAVVMAIALVDRVGRRQLMKISLMGVVFCLVALGLFFFMKDLDATSVLYFEWLPLFILSVYLYLFTLGAGPLPWAMMGELFPAHVKGVCSSICGASSFVLAYITCETFAHLMGVLTLAGTFWLYAGLCFVSAVWLFFFLAETKGKSLEEIQHVLGVLYVYVVGCWSDLKWLSLCCGIIPIVFFLLFCGAPESPVYLLENNHREEAIHALQWLRGPTGDIRSDLQDIEEMVEESHGNVGTLREMMSTKAALKGLWTQMGILFFQPLSGQNIIIFYAVSIFVAAGSSLDPNVASIILASVQVVATACSATIVDRAGRRILLIFSYSAMGVCLIVVGAFFFMLEQNEKMVRDVRWLPIFVISIYLVVFSMGCGPLSWSMIGEIFPQEVKAICSAICAATNAVMTFLVSKTYLDLEETLTTAGAFWLYAILNFVAAIWIFFFVIETKGKTLDEIQKQLGS